MTAPAGQKPLSLQTPNSSQPLCMVEGEITTLKDSQGKPVQGRVELFGYITPAWRYLLGALLKVPTSGAVTQQGSITSPVTLNTTFGRITTVVNNWIGDLQSFFVKNSLVAASDVIALSVSEPVSTTPLNQYFALVTGVEDGQFQVTIISPTTATESVILNFTQIKAP